MENRIISSQTLSVVQYAVQVLKVKHIIVCGHYNCGGVKAALSNQRSDFTLLNKWLLHVKDVYRLHRGELDAIDSFDDKANRLVELNVVEQVNHLSYTSIIQTSWKKHQRPMVHGWVYALDDGLLKQLIMLGPESEVDPVYKLVDGPA